MREVLEVRADAAENAEDALNEEGRLDELAIDKVGKIIEVADVVALELELGAVALAQFRHHALDLAERIGQNEVLRALEIFLLPRKFELLVSGRRAGDVER